MESDVQATKSLPDAMQRLFTRLTLNQARKKQKFTRSGFKVYIVTVSGIDIALGVRGENFGVFAYNKESGKVGLLVLEICFTSTKVCVWTPVSIPLRECPEEASQIFLAVSTLFSELKKETER